jgi:chromosomal replication initiator protein
MITTLNPTALSEWGARLDHTHGPRFQALATRICHEVAVSFDVCPSSLFEAGRPATITLARQVSMHLLRLKSKASLVSIGDLFRRDHGTVIHALKSIQARRDTDPAFDSELTTLESHFP